MLNRYFATLCVALTALAGCTAPNVELVQARDLYARGDFYQAWVSIKLAHQKDAGSREVQEEYWKIRKAWLLKKGQEQVFHNEDLDAIGTFEQVLVHDEGNEIALRWIDKCKFKLANRASAKGESYRKAGDLENALRAYNDALVFEPGNARAEEGLELLGETWRAMRAKARSHYLDGVRALADQLFAQTEYHMLIALDRDPTLEEAREPAAQAQRRIAEERFRNARDMEKAGHAAAALREYEVLRKDHPNLPEIDVAIERAERETEARRLAGEGELAVFRGEFAKARKLLEDAMQLTSRDSEAIAERLLLVHEREIEHLYTLTRDMEIQGDFQEALAGYRGIDHEVPGFRDVRDRIADLEIRIEEAEKAYAAAVEAESKGEADTAIDHFIDVMVYWPSYQDAKQRLEALRAARGS